MVMPVQSKYWETKKGKYANQKSTAKSRGISWEFSFNEWWSMWEPYWELRGRHHSGYVMCRYGDKGPYSPDNCRIDRSVNNVIEAKRVGITGVRFYPDRRGSKKWTAQIQVRGKKYWSCHKTLFDAVCWRKSRELAHKYGDPAAIPEEFKLKEVWG